LIFSVEHPWDQEMEVCSYEVPWVTNDFALRGHSFIWVYISNTFKIILMNHWPQSFNIWHGMFFKTRELTFVQMMSLR